jgi:hypothetical protein
MKSQKIEEIPYKKEPERTKPTGSILPAPMPEPVRKNMNTEESDSHTTCAHFTRPVCSDLNPRRKKKKKKKRIET